MSPVRVIWILTGLLFTAGVVHFSATMASKTVPYFSFERAVAFLGTKPDAVLDTPWYMAAFYIHISSSLLVIITGIPQLWPAVLKRFPVWHRRLGLVYLSGVLLLAAPSGFIIALHANAGLPTQVAFMLQSLVWWCCTAAAWYSIRRGRWLQHTEWMIRSFAVTLAAMSLRSESYLMYYYFQTKPVETYITVAWLSWVGNLCIAETLIWFGLGKKMIQATDKSY